MTLSRPARWLLGAALRASGSSFIYVPLLIVVLNSFNASRRSPGRRPGSRWSGGRRRSTTRASARRLSTSIVVALVATTHRRWSSAPWSRWRCRALPVLRPRHDLAAGRAADRTARHRHRSGAEQRLHASSSAGSTVLSRWSSATRRSASSSSSTTWSPGCGARRRTTRGGVDGPRRHAGLQTFRLVDLPADAQRRWSPAALLAFGLSFDEIIVTHVHGRPRRPDPAASGSSATCSGRNQAPIVNVVAAFLVIVSILPVYLAQRLSSDDARPAGWCSPQPARPPPGGRRRRYTRG